MCELTKLRPLRERLLPGTGQARFAKRSQQFPEFAQRGDWTILQGGFDASLVIEQIAEHGMGRIPDIREQKRRSLLLQGTTTQRSGLQDRVQSGFDAEQVAGAFEASQEGAQVMHGGAGQACSCA